MEIFAILFGPAERKKIGGIAVDPKVMFIRITLEVKAETTSTHFGHVDLRKCNTVHSLLS